MAQSIHHNVFKVLADLNAKKKKQRVSFLTKGGGGYTLNGVSMQYMVNFIRRNLSNTMEKLDFCFHGVTMDAVEIFRAYLLVEMETLKKIRLQGHLGNDKARRLLSSLQNVNPSVTEFDLVHVGLEGAAGGEVASTLMQNNSILKLLFFRFNPLGVQGARALQPGIAEIRQCIRWFCNNVSLVIKGFLSLWMLF